MHTKLYIKILSFVCKLLAILREYSFLGAVQQCRKRKLCSAVPKMKTLFNRAENMNKFPHIKCGNQKLNGERLQFQVALKDFRRENLLFRRFGAKIIV